MRKPLLTLKPGILSALPEGVRDYVSTLTVDEDAYIRLIHAKGEKSVLIATPQEIILIDTRVHTAKWNQVEMSFHSNKIELTIHGKADPFSFQSTIKDQNVLADIMALAGTGERSGAYDIYKKNKDDKSLNRPMNNVSDSAPQNINAAKEVATSHPPVESSNARQLQNQGSQAADPVVTTTSSSSREYLEVAGGCLVFVLPFATLIAFFTHHSPLKVFLACLTAAILLGLAGGSRKRTTTPHHPTKTNSTDHRTQRMNSTPTFTCPICKNVKTQKKFDCPHPGCRMILDSPTFDANDKELAIWSLDTIPPAPTGSNEVRGIFKATYLGGDVTFLTTTAGPNSNAPYVKKGWKAEIRMLPGDNVQIRVAPLNTPVCNIHLGDGQIGIDSTEELEKQLRMGKIAGIAAVGMLLLPQVALLGLIGGIRRDVNRTNYVMHIALPTMSGAFLIEDERAGIAIARRRSAIYNAQPVADTGSTSMARLKELEGLLSSNLITQDEFDAKRGEIIGGI